MGNKGPDLKSQCWSNSYCFCWELFPREECRMKPKASTDYKMDFLKQNCLVKNPPHYLDLIPWLELELAARIQPLADLKWSRWEAASNSWMMRRTDFKLIIKVIDEKDRFQINYKSYQLRFFFFFLIQALMLERTVLLVLKGPQNQNCKEHGVLRKASA